MRRWVVALGFTVLVAPVRATEAQSVQEVLLRAKPAVALVVSEVAAQVTLNCGGARTTVEPAPFRETGTGWFVSASGLLGDSNALKLGDHVHIIGFPGVVLTHELLNASAKVEASVTNGAVSGFRQDKTGQPVIQTDAPAAWGNSGGPTIDDRGLVVGVLTFVTQSGGDQGTIVQGFNFVIPAQAVQDFLQGTEVK